MCPTIFDNCRGEIVSECLHYLEAFWVTLWKEKYGFNLEHQKIIFVCFNFPSISQMGGARFIGKFSRTNSGRSHTASDMNNHLWSLKSQVQTPSPAMLNHNLVNSDNLWKLLQSLSWRQWMKQTPPWPSSAWISPSSWPARARLSSSHSPCPQDSTFP